MHGRGREQRRDRDAVRPDHAVGQDDDVVAAVHGRFGAVAEPVERAVHGRGAELGRIGDVEGLGVEAVLEMADAADLLEILVGEDRLAHLEPLAARGAFEIEDVRPRPDERHEAHDELLADRIDRRVRDLREVLLEIGVEQLRPGRTSAEIGVSVPIEPTASWPVTAIGCMRSFRSSCGVAEGLLAIEQRHVRAGLARLDGLQVLEHDLGALQPFLVGMGVGELRA